MRPVPIGMVIPTMPVAIALGLINVDLCTRIDVGVRIVDFMHHMRLVWRDGTTGGGSGQQADQKNASDSEHGVAP